MVDYVKKCCWQARLRHGDALDRIAGGERCANDECILCKGSRTMRPCHGTANAGENEESAVTTVVRGGHKGRLCPAPKG